jgi:hypothetical protein
MRYCHSCRRLNSGEPLFCEHCGRTFDVRLCPHRHSNARNATFCRECGSRELSTPHPPGSALIAIVARVLTQLPGVLLLLVTVFFFVGFVDILVRKPQALLPAMLAGLLLAGVWYLYMQLPAFLRGFISKKSKRSKRGPHDH